eukprot:gene20171-1046_t
MITPDHDNHRLDTALAVDQNELQINQSHCDPKTIGSKADPLLEKGTTDIPAATSRKYYDTYVAHDPPAPSVAMIPCGNLKEFQNAKEGKRHQETQSECAPPMTTGSHSVALTLFVTVLFSSTTMKSKAASRGRAASKGACGRTTRSKGEPEGSCEGTERRFVGVYEHTKTKGETVWHAQIREDGKLHHLGSFDNENDAARARDAKARQFGRTNLNFNDDDQAGKVKPKAWRQSTSKEQPKAKQSTSKKQSKLKKQSKELPVQSAPISSKFMGVYWNKMSQKWAAAIQNDQRRCHLGMFDNEKDAARAWDVEARKLGKLRFNFEEEDCALKPKEEPEELPASAPISSPKGKGESKEGNKEQLESEQPPVQSAPISGIFNKRSTPKQEIKEQIKEQLESKELSLQQLPISSPRGKGKEQRESKEPPVQSAPISIQKESKEQLKSKELPEQPAPISSPKAKSKEQSEFKELPVSISSLKEQRESKEPTVQSAPISNKSDKQSNPTKESFKLKEESEDPAPTHQTQSAPNSTPQSDSKPQETSADV